MGNERLKGNSISKGVIIYSQGVPIQVDLYLLDLGGYDAVLGAHWLCTRGPVVWDFSALSTSYHKDGKEYHLKGMPNPRVVKPAQLAKDLNNYSQAFALQLMNVQTQPTFQIGDPQLQSIFS